MSKRAVLSSFDIAGSRDEQGEDATLSEMALGQLVMKNIMDYLSTVTACVMLGLTCRRALAALLFAVRDGEWPLRKVKRAVAMIEHSRVFGMDHAVYNTGANLGVRKDVVCWAVERAEKIHSARYALYKGVVYWSNHDSGDRRTANAALHAQELLYTLRASVSAFDCPSFGSLAGVVAAYLNMMHYIRRTRDRDETDKHTRRVVFLAGHLTAYAIGCGVANPTSLRFLRTKLAIEHQPRQLVPHLRALFAEAVVGGIANYPHMSDKIIASVAVLLEL